MGPVVDDASSSALSLSLRMPAGNDSNQQLGDPSHPSHLHDSKSSDCDGDSDTDTGNDDPKREQTENSQPAAATERSQDINPPDADTNNETENKNDSDDEYNQHDDDSSSSDSDSQLEDDEGSMASENSSDSESNRDEEGLSEYERLREERIRRNQQYLAKLGLDQTLSQKQQPKKRKRTPANSNVLDVERRSSLGRASKQKPIQYNVDEAMNFRKLMAVKNSTSDQTSTSVVPKPKSSSSSNKNNRLPMEVYKEFKRIGRERKDNIRRLQKYHKSALKHLQYWQRRLDRFKVKLEASVLKQGQKEVEEKERQLLGGKTKLECWQELEKRSIDLWTVLLEFDKQAAERKQRQEQERIEQEMLEHQIELDRKLELVDALDRFPTALQETNEMLNNLLLKRAPKDPPPPRRSRRVSLDEHQPDSQPLTQQTTTSSNDSQAVGITHHQTSHSTLDRIRAAIAWKKRITHETAKTTTTTDTVEKASSMPQDANEETKQQKESPNVGGWISPPFAESLDRSWLSREKPSDDLATSPPQPGQLFLYYPGAHKAFLVTHPDIWGTRNKIRQPLWEQAAATRDSLNSIPVEETTIQRHPTQSKGRKRRSTIASEAVKTVEPIQRAKRHRVSMETEHNTLDLTKETNHMSTTRTTSSRRRNGIADQVPSSPRVKEPPLQNAQMSEESSASSSRRTSTRHTKSHIPITADAQKPVSHRRRSEQSPPVVDAHDKTHVINRANAARDPSVINDESDVLQQSDYLGARASRSGNIKPCTQTNTIWWTDEWIERIDADLGQYPILCRVEHTYAEFPYDANIEHRKVDKEGHVTWIIPDHKQSSNKRKDHETPRSIGLCIVLQPLTPVIPPEWDETSGVLTSEQVLPPQFSVLTFPSNNFTPFLVPFVWAYAKHHSFSIGDTVVSSWNDNEDNPKCKVAEFPSIGNCWGSFRLNDKLPIIRSLVEQFSTGTLAEIYEALAVPGSKLTTQFSLPPDDAALMVDFLSLYLAHKSHNDQVTQQTTTMECTLVDLIRSTLPLFAGIGVRPEVFNRKVTYIAGWTLRRSKKGKDTFATQLVTLLRERLRQGVPNRLENSLRIKLRYTVQDFLKNRPEAASFMDMVTEDIAPSYYCAVPVAMHFNRILARLNVSNMNDHCYYSSLQSILGDVQTIWDNCLLYNSPDSPLVSVCSILVPALQKQLVNVLTKHENEHDALLVADSERKQLELVETLKSTFPEDTAKVDPNDASILATLNTPYKGLLDRSKLQILHPDSSWQDKPTTHRVSWLPQCGDQVLYSHRLHANFIKENKSHLSNRQRVLPSFRIADHTEQGPTSETLDAGWLNAKIVSVHATFPCEIEYSKESPLIIPAPVMALVLHFVDNGADYVNSVQSIFWTVGASFVRPAWSTQESPNNFVDDDSLNNTIKSLASLPQGIHGESVRRITRIFEVLKSRCLHDVDPDYVDPKLSLQNSLKDGMIKVNKPGTRNLPSFEELLSQDSNIMDGKSVSTRGIRRTDDDEAIRKLSEALYLPPWTIDTLEDETKKRKMSSYEAMIPFPNICLEFVRLRLKYGYYRQSVGLVGDLQEAYLVSTLFILSGFASRRKNRISTQKIAKLLQSGNVASDCVLASDQGTYDEESNLIERLEKARRLYAMAILAVSDTGLIERILGLYDKPSSRAQPRQTVANSDWSEMIGAAERIRYLLAAAGREPCLNKFDNQGSIMFKIKVNGETIKYKDESNATLQNFITLGHKEYTSNDALARVLLRRPGRRAPCIRCQLYGLTFYTCRVIRCHSNPDFDFVANWKEVGGLHGMLLPFNALGGVTLPALLQESAASHTPHSRDDNGMLEDPTDDLEKAQEAVKIAASLEKEAEALASDRVKLSAKFIQETFPVDPTDGHYIWCTICGLSGDVLCCDGCSNVVHSKCIGLSTIPEDDWFCDVCVSKRHSPDIINEQATNTNHSPAELNGSTVPSMLGGNDARSPQEQRKALLTDDEFEAQVDKLGHIIDELDRKQYRSTSRKQSQIPITVGTVFYKTFSKFGRFKGVVVTAPTESHPYCKVEYEDGDVEELEPLEIANLLRDDSSATAVNAGVQRIGHSLADGRRQVSGESGGDAQRKHGRPLKYPPGGVCHDSSQKLAIDRMGKNDSTENRDFAVGGKPEALSLQPKKKRGRPRKNPSESGNTTSAPTKRPRGRPPKYISDPENKIVTTSAGKRVHFSSIPGNLSLSQPVPPQGRHSTSRRHRKVRM